jgi:hypothetical protein
MCGCGAERRSTLKQQVLTLLALLVQKYRKVQIKMEAGVEQREGAL